MSERLPSISDSESQPTPLRLVPEALPPLRWKEVTPQWPGCGLPPALQSPMDLSSGVSPELWAPLPDSMVSGALLQGWHSGPGPGERAGDEGAFTVTLGKHGRALNKGQECFVPSALCPLLTECPWHVRAPVCCQQRGSALASRWGRSAGQLHAPQLKAETQFQGRKSLCGHRPRPSLGPGCTPGCSVSLVPSVKPECPPLTSGTTCLSPLTLAHRSDRLAFRGRAESHRGPWQ